MKISDLLRRDCAQLLAARPYSVGLQIFYLRKAIMVLLTEEKIPTTINSLADVLSFCTDAEIELVYKTAARIAEVDEH